jgi:hypothetical protein
LAQSPFKEFVYQDSQDVPNKTGHLRHKTKGNMEEHSTAEAAAGEAFVEAVAAGDVPRVRQLLHEHPPRLTINAVDHLGW